MEKTHETPQLPPTAEPTPAQAAAAAAHAADSEPTYVFPDAARGAILHIEKATGTLWLGFKLTGFDYQEATLWLDSKKLDILRIYKQIAQAIQEREALGNVTQPKRGIGGMITDLGGRIMARGRGGR